MLFASNLIRTLTMTPVLVLSACGGMSDSGVSQPPADSIDGAANANVSAPVNHYRVGGTVTGLSGNVLILELNGGSELPIEADGAFTFPGSLSSGTAYSVTTKYQPTVRREICTVTNGSGMVGTTNIGNVSVNCTIAVGFVYVVDPNGQIAAYGITPGTGAPIPDGSFAIAPSDGYAAMVAAPSGHFPPPSTTAVTTL